MALAIFDLDNTLIGGDSDNLWGQFLCEHGLVEQEGFLAQNDQFYIDYQNGQLNIDAYLRFALGPLRGQPLETLNDWHRQFMLEKIEPIMLPKAQTLIEQHRAQGDVLVIVTATNEFVTRPIADALGIEHLLACEAEMVDGRYTGEPAGIPSFHSGKITRLELWLSQHSVNPDGATFYSDSHNDLPLLNYVDHPVAVDPDETLRAKAEREGWQVITLRQE